MSLILGAQSATAAGFSIDNSCRFNGSDSKLNKTATSDAPTLATKATISFWVKSCSHEIDPEETQNICYTNGAVSPYFNLKFPGEVVAGIPQIYLQNAGTSNTVFYPSRYIRDHAAWYHLCFTYDSTPATPSSSSIKLFVNGVQETAFSTETYPSQDVVSGLTKASQAWYIAANYNGTGNFFNGYIAEFMVVDGQALDADQFGEFNEDSPTIWQPIDISGITLGNQGFYLDFKDSANLGNDVGGGTDFTSTNLAAIDQTTDTPSNNFCVMNPLDNYYASATFSEGNCKVATGSGKSYNTSTVGLSAGKWYFEAKLTTAVGTDFIGIAYGPSKSASVALGTEANTYGYMSGDGNIQTGGSNTSYGSAYGATDVIGVYLDLDASKMYIANDGVIQNSGTGYDITAAPSTANGVYFAVVADDHSSNASTWEVNFGNPVAALTSAVNDVNGYGNFEYSPNDGGSASFDGSAKDFLAICTKNLGSDGG
jgi:hypothetical protein